MVTKPQAGRSLTKTLSVPHSGGATPKARLPRQKAGQPLWAYIVALGESIPDQVLDEIPADLASNHHHYLHGSSKQDA